MRTITILFAVLGMAVCCACSAPTEEVITFQIDPAQPSEKSFDQFYKLKEFIVLETNELSVIPELNHIIFTDDAIIVANYDHKAFYRFGRDGRFLDKVDRSGNGPGEYGVRIGAFILDETGEHNLIMNKGNTLLYYNYDRLEYVKERPWIGRMAIPASLPDGSFLAYTEFDPSPKDETGYFVQWLNSEGERIKGFIPKPDQVVFNVGTQYLGPFVYTRNGTNYVMPYIGNRMYSFHDNDSALVERYRFAFKGFSEIQLNQLTQKDLSSFSYVFDYYQLYLYYVGQKNMLLQASSGENRPGLVLIADLHGHNITTVKTEDLEDRDNELPLSLITPHNLSAPMVLLMPERLMNHTTTRPESLGSKLKKQLVEDSNPVLLIYEER